MAGKFVLRKSGDEFMFNLKAENGDVIATSARYGTKAAAQKGIESVRENAAAATVEDQTIS